VDRAGLRAGAGFGRSVKARGAWRNLGSPRAQGRSG
jgi:hypothetical protein